MIHPRNRGALQRESRFRHYSYPKTGCICTFPLFVPLWYYYYGSLHSERIASRTHRFPFFPAPASLGRDGVETSRSSRTPLFTRNQKETVRAFEDSCRSLYTIDSFRRPRRSVEERLRETSGIFTSRPNSSHFPKDELISGVETRRQWNRYPH
ncbi:hypothetical protein BJ875DRAFT_154861 [Amylocarpus encephaloides]|uniref:Uncharacterized protein n=1 Tax=Amylocarpus encephaloides TaxID=45428 RepID=A0A9P8C1H6_9HELO|nr:hypothetical protein BJ875DRAFT_154861 [Amylocarpus encephaloides]